MMRTACPAPDRRVEDVARGQVGDDASVRAGLRGAVGIGRADGVAVHRRVVERRDIEWRDDVLGEHLAERREQREAHRGKPLEERENALARLFDAGSCRVQSRARGKCTEGPGVERRGGPG